MGVVSENFQATFDRARDRTTRSPKCKAAVYLRHLSDLPLQCSNRTTDASGLCWRHR